MDFHLKEYETQGRRKGADPDYSDEDAIDIDQIESRLRR